MVATFVFSACGDSKPSKDAVTKAMYEKFEKSPDGKKASDSEIKFMRKFVKCTIDKSYDDLSTKTLELIADKNVKIDDLNDKIKGKQNDILDKASNKCG